MLKQAYGTKFTYDYRNNIEIRGVTDKEKRFIIKEIGLVNMKNATLDIKYNNRSGSIETNDFRLGRLERYIVNNTEELKEDGLYNILVDIEREYRSKVKDKIRELEEKRGVTYGERN